MFKCESCESVKNDEDRATPCEDTYPELVDSSYCVECIDDVISEIQLERYSEHEVTEYDEWSSFDPDC